MSEQEKGNGGANGPRERLKEEFASLPLGNKLASLFELEMVALNESISYVFNSSGDIFGKVADVVNDFSERVQCEFRKGTEHGDGAAPKEEKGGAAGAKGSKEKAGEKKQEKSGD